MSKGLCKYIAAFDYVGKGLIVLSATSGGVFTASFTSVLSTLEGIARAALTFVFSLKVH